MLSGTVISNSIRLPGWYWWLSLGLHVLGIAWLWWLMVKAAPSLKLSINSPQPVIWVDGTERVTVPAVTRGHRLGRQFSLMTQPRSTPKVAKEISREAIDPLTPSTAALDSEVTSVTQSFAQASTGNPVWSTLSPGMWNESPEGRYLGAFWQAFHRQAFNWWQSSARWVSDENWILKVYVRIGPEGQLDWRDCQLETTQTSGQPSQLCESLRRWMSHWRQFASPIQWGAEPKERYVVVPVHLVAR